MVVICEQCGRKFPKPCKLKYHIDVVHLKLRNFKCEYCEESCANVTALKYHIIRKHSDDRDYACEDCDRTFKTQSGLDQHYQTHDKGKIFTCLECGMELKKRTSYQYHLKKHEKVLDTICAICGKQFSDYLKMKEHTYNMHRKNPQIPCAFCNKKYYMQVSLDRHLANHAVFSCDLCGQKFLRRSDVTKHIQQHLRDRKESNKIIYASKIRIRKVKKLKVQKLKGERFKKNMQGIDDEGSREYTQLLDPNEIQNFLVMEIREEQNPLMIPQELVEIKEEPAEISDIEPVEVKQEIIEDKDLLSELGQIQFENILLEPPNVKTLKVSPQKKIKNFKLHRKGKKFENKIIKLEVTHNVKLEDTEFKCKNCDKTFTKQVHLQKHVESTHSNHLQPDKQFCVDCSLLCSSKNELKTHGFQVHHRIYEYDCDLCEFTFVLSQARARHKLTCHDIEQNPAEDSTLNCEFCELTFMELRSLQSHKNIAHGQPLRKKSKLSNVEKVDGKYQCEFCLDLFSNNTSRVRHIEGKHEKIKKYPCKICEELFVIPDHIVKHIKKVHDGGTKLTRTCGVCGVEFRLAQEFYDHIETHKGYLICEICGECLPDKDSFKHHNISHRKIDEKYKKVVCDLCGLKFLSDALLKSHMYTHSDLKSFICDECGKSFRFQSSLCVHKKSHNKQVECNVCHKMFASKQGLSFHYVMHTGAKPFSCKLCGKRFSGAAQKSYHMKKHRGTLPELPCENCGKTFTSKFFLKSHMVQQHSKTKDFSCNQCGEEFKFMKQLQNHIEIKCPTN